MQINYAYVLFLFIFLNFFFFCYWLTEQAKFQKGALDGSIHLAYRVQHDDSSSVFVGSR